MDMAGGDWWINKRFLVNVDPDQYHIEFGAEM